MTSQRRLRDGLGSLPHRKRDIAGKSCTQTPRLLLLCVGVFGNARATLIVTAPYQNGIVVCADKRRYDPACGDSDTETKIVQLGTTSAFSSTGTVRFLALPNFSELWNADKITSEYYKGTEFNADKLDALFQHLAASYRKYLDSIPFSWWPDSAFEAENALFQLIFFHVDEDASIKIVGFQFLYRKALPPEIKGLPFEFPASLAIAFGNTAVFREIKSGTNKDFERFRKEPLLRSFIIDKRPASKVSKETAIRFARRLIIVTSENTSKIENSTFHVGPTCDCAAIDTKKGFEWIEAK